MSKHLQRDLDRLRQAIVSMVSSVEDAVYKAVEALLTRNVVLAEEIMEGEDQIDEDENLIENECMKILAMHQPVAGDLRGIVVALKITTDLERMGDLAEDIAERAINLAQMEQIRAPQHIQRMTDVATSMVRQSLDSFVNLDSRLARKVIRLDDEVDDCNRDCIAELVQVMEETPTHVRAALSFFSAVRQIERIADHATNIAEEVVYMVEGEIIRHQSEDNDE